MCASPCRPASGGAEDRGALGRERHGRAVQGGSSPVAKRISVGATSRSISRGWSARLTMTRSEPRWTTIQLSASSQSTWTADRSASPGPDAPGAARSAGGARRAAGRAAPGRARDQSSLDRVKVAGSCGSGTSSAPSRARRTPPPALARRPRPARGSAWSVKNCHGRARAPLLAHEQHRRERRRSAPARPRRRAARGRGSRRSGRRSRGCRPGRGSAGRRGTVQPGSGRGSTGRPWCRPRKRRPRAVVEERPASAPWPGRRARRRRSRRSSPAPRR